MDEISRRALICGLASVAVAPQIHTRAPWVIEYRLGLIPKYVGWQQYQQIIDAARQELIDSEKHWSYPQTFNLEKST